MAGGFDGPRLMDGDVPGSGGHNALIAFQQGVDDRGIGLGAAHQEKDVGPGQRHGRADLLAGALRKCIEAISGLLLHIGLGQAFQNQRVRTLAVIAGKRQYRHKTYLILCKLSIFLQASKWRPIKNGRA